MKKIHRSRTVVAILCLCFGVAIGYAAPESEEVFPDAGSLITNLTDHVNSLATVVFEVAMEQHAKDSRDGRLWLMGLSQTQPRIRKYTDGRFVLVVLPLFKGEDNRGLTNYVANYNAGTERACDLLVDQGKLSDAKQGYELLIKTGFMEAETLKRKLEALRKIQAQDAVEENKKLIRSLSEQLISRLRLDEITRLPFVQTTNLLSVGL